MIARSFCKALLPLCLLVSATPSLSQSLKIKNIRTGGSGCPNGTVTTSISSDRKAFTLIFDEYEIEIDNRPSVRANCQIDLTMKVPAGYSFALGKFDYRGYAYLERGIKATQTAFYYFTGQGNSGVFTTQMRGMYDRNYLFTDTIPLSSMVWSPCGSNRNLQISTDLRLTKDRSNYPDAFGVISTDSLDGEFRTKVTWKFHWQWRRC